MQKYGLFITLQHLKLKVANLTQTRPMPIQSGMLRSSWWYWFKIGHLDLNIRQVKGLTINKYKTFYDNLQILCIQNNYNVDDLWNSNNAHASKQTNTQEFKFWLRGIQTTL